MYYKNIHYTSSYIFSDQYIEEIKDPKYKGQHNYRHEDVGYWAGRDLEVIKSFFFELPQKNQYRGLIWGIGCSDYPFYESFLPYETMAFFMRQDKELYLDIYDKYEKYITRNIGKEYLKIANDMESDSLLRSTDDLLLSFGKNKSHRNDYIDMFKIGWQTDIKNEKVNTWNSKNIMSCLIKIPQQVKNKMNFKIYDICNIENITVDYDFIFSWNILRYLAPHLELKDNIFYHSYKNLLPGGLLIFNDNLRSLDDRPYVDPYELDDYWGMKMKSWTEVAEERIYDLGLTNLSNNLPKSDHCGEIRFLLKKPY